MTTARRYSRGIAFVLAAATGILADVDAAIRTVVAQTVAPKAVGLWMRERGRS